MPDKIDRIKKLKKKHEKKWLAIKDVVAVGIGKTSGGSIGIIISVKEEAGQVKSQIPSEIDKIPIEVQETGEMKTL